MTRRLDYLDTEAAIGCGERGLELICGVPIVIEIEAS